MTTLRSTRRQLKIGVLLVGLGIVYFLAIFQHTETGHAQDGTNDFQGKHRGRHLTALNCTPKSSEEFPDDLFTREERKHGAILIHLLVMLYLFVSLAIVCDGYFVSSLEQISEVLNLTPDVAGATFMAAGSSAPELFTALIGVFITKSDVGTSTIVGSAVFNILGLVALCGIFSGMVIDLTWWPIVRDTVFYMISVLALIYVMYDEKIYWYDGLLLCALYLVYIAVMYFNSRLEEIVKSGCRSRQATDDETEPFFRPNTKRAYSTSSFDENPEPDETTRVQIAKSVEESEEHEYERPTPRFKRSGSSLNIDHEEPEFESPFKLPETWPARIFWAIMLPMQVCFFLTIPDCRRLGFWKRLYPLTFTMSIVWIAVLSYVMVWMVVLFGDTFGIPDTVMGLTLLAAGSSVPDALAGLLVARKGYGDMAVCNGAGSNVFDILICLGLPWLLRTTLVAGEDVIEIRSSGLFYSLLTLVSTVFILLIVLVLFKWRLSIYTGFTFLLLYLITITFSCMYELNVFGELNLPPCD